jgi:Fe-S-cluster containining protein
MARDRDLIQIVDAALDEANRRAGTHVVCRRGCTECCIGPFPITQLDAVRLRRGLEELAAHDPERAARVRARAKRAIVKMAPDYPGDLATGVLRDGEDAAERFATLAEEEPCPALDPATGACDLYAARPITCRTFGPAIRWDGEDLGVCELNFQGLSDDEIASYAVTIEGRPLEAELLDELPPGETIVAFALGMR